MAEREPVPYDDTPFPSWAPKVNAWPWQPNRASNGKIIGWRKQGQCPRCGDTTPVEIGLVASVDMVLTEHVYARCECKVEHADGKVGCGASAMVEGPADD